MRHVAATRAILVGLLFTAALLAQRDLGTITGTVIDAQGAVIPNAKITITEDATNLTYVVTTNEAGEYSRPALKPGTYTVTAEAPGFRRVAQKNVEIAGGDRVGVPITLPLGDISQSVEVQAVAPLLQTESTVVGANLDSKSVRDLPLGGQRNATYLARLSPGVVPAENGARDANNGGFSANGVRSNGQNNFLLNGVDNNVNTIDFLNQTSYTIGPSPDAIGEMNILTNGYNAEYGRAAGGVVNVTLKSGTNELHGSVFEYMQNRVLDANRWENNLNGVQRGHFVQNQFGGSMGGPIIKNRLFIFGDYEGTRIRSTGGAVSGLGYAQFETIPTVPMRSGNFASELGPSLGVDPASGQNVISGAIYDPLSTVYQNGQPVSRTMFPNNQIPASRMDPVAAKLLSLYPAPNQPIKSGTWPTNDYYLVTPGGANTDQGDGRVDYRVTEKDSLFGSISWSNTSKTSGVIFPGPLDGDPFQGASEIDLGRNAQLGYTRVWNPRLISETRVGFSRLVTSRLGANPGTDLFTQFGMGGLDPTHNYANNGGLPQFSFSYYSQIGANDWIPTKEFNNVWDFIQNVALTKGSHSMKFGAEYRPIRFPFFQVPDPHGNIGYSTSETAFPSQAIGNTGQKFSALTGDAMASMLLGQIDSGNLSTTNFVSSQKSAWAFYAQDDWKVTPKLTLNLGVRYELFSPIDERFGRQSNFVFQTLTLNIPKGRNQDAALPPNFATAFPNVNVTRGVVPSTLIPWDKTDFGPRVGIAYQITEKTVIRAGFGIFYGGEENQGGSPNRGESVPFNETVNLVRTGGVSTFVGVSDPACTGCNYFPQGLVSGYPSNTFSLPAPVSFRGIDPDFRNPLVSKWNLTVQRQLPWQLALDVGYDGNHQARQIVLWNSDVCPNLGTTNGSYSCQTLSLVPSVYSGLSDTTSFGFGNYDALSVKGEKRYSAGLQFLASYTWSHTLANSSTPLSGATNFGVPDLTNYGSAYSSAGWDIRHNFTLAFNYDVPFGRGRTFGGNMNKIVDTVVGNWHMNGILSLRTGQPYTLRSNQCQGVWNACRPDLVPGTDPNAAPSGGRTPSEWFNVNNVKVPAPLTGGNLGLQSNTGPPTRVMDLSLFKDFPITERWRVQFRAEALNIANTPQFSVPDANIQDLPSGNFGRITSTQAASERHIQLSLRVVF
ncbi:MAG: TonB-dependent receptor [Acidobacteriaceae bacterium]|nr:TonB-dependent receptor [Acidobacteriaceae bacterium]